jgi:hypothetical protein
MLQIAHTKFFDDAEFEDNKNSLAILSASR